MAKQKFIRNKPHVNIGTVGHVDHGKTTLTGRSRCTRRHRRCPRGLLSIGRSDEGRASVEQPSERPQRMYSKRSGWTRRRR